MHFAFEPAGNNLIWNVNYWPTAHITFGNLNQKALPLNPKNVMHQPFLDFSKAYLRYQQGHKPTQAQTEIRALKCLERALLETTGKADIAGTAGIGAGAAKAQRP